MTCGLPPVAGDNKYFVDLPALHAQATTTSILPHSNYNMQFSVVYDYHQGSLASNSSDEILVYGTVFVSFKPTVRSIIYYWIRKTL